CGGGERERPGRQEVCPAWPDVRSMDRRALGLAGRVRRAAHSDVADPRLLRLRRQGCARGSETNFAEGLWYAAARSRQPMVHVLLLHHLWRLRRTGQRVAAVFHRAIPRIRRCGGPAGFLDRRLRFGFPPRRRPDRPPPPRYTLLYSPFW